MRSAAFAALAGALGVSAFEKFAFFEEAARLPRSDCGHLDGCGKVDRGSYVPDARTFFFPEKHNELGRHWDLINKDRHYGHHDHYGKHHDHHGKHHHYPHKHHGHHDHHRNEEIISRVNFDFFEESLVFDFERFDDHERFEFKERSFFEEIEIIVAVDEPNFDHGHRYSLRDGHCHHDKDHHYRCRVPYHDLVHGGYKEMCPIKERGGQRLFVKIRSVVRYEEERFELINRGHDNKDYFSLSYACSECKYEEYKKDCHRDDHHHKPCHDDKNCHKDHKDHYKHKPCYDDKCHKDHHKDHHKHKPCHDDKCHKDKHYKDHKGHHPHYPRNIDYECEGTFLKAYGTGSDCKSFGDLAQYSHPNSCGHNRDGYYHRYPRNELEVAVRGPIELKGYNFGHFTVVLEKKGEDTFIFVEVKIDDAEYFVTEIAAFVECDGGIDDLSLASINQPNICKPESYPHRHHDDRGLDHFKFEILDEFKCRGDYFIAIYVLVCVAEDNCEYKKHHYKPYGGYGY